METKIWSEFAKSYADVLIEWSLYQELIQKAKNYLFNLDKVLDLGCGPGLFSKELSLINKEVIGIDNNEEMLLEAKKRSSQINFIKSNVEGLFFKDNYFEGIVSNNVIYYLNNPLNMLSESYRVLKPKGKIVISGPRKNVNIKILTDHLYNEFKQKGLLENMEKDLDHFFQCTLQLQQDKMRNLYEINDLLGLLKSVGFSKVLEASYDIYLKQSYLICMEK